MNAPHVDFEKGEWTPAPAPAGLPDLGNDPLGTIAIPLKVPFTFRDVAYEAVSLRIPTGADFETWIARPADEQVPAQWLRQILDAPADILNVMWGGDYIALLNACNRLLAQPDGSAPAPEKKPETGFFQAAADQDEGKNPETGFISRAAPDADAPPAPQCLRARIRTHAKALYAAYSFYRWLTD